MRAFPLVLVALLATCVAPKPLSGPELVRHLDERCPQVVVHAGVEVHAALDEEAREAWAEAAAHADGLVRASLGCEDGPPVRVYLLDVEVEADLREGVGAGGFEGFAFAEDFLLLYVPRDTRDARQRAWMRMETLRHELAHVHARRLGLAGPKWFNEGFAQEFERPILSGSGWHADAFPADLARAREFAGAGAAKKLVGWTTSEGLDSAELEERYTLSLSFVRFQLERNAGGTLVERARAVLATNPVELEAEWLEWLRKLDAVETLAHGASSTDAKLRAAAAGALPILAEARLPELHTRRADELALAWLADPELAPDAATFLVYFRAAELLAGDVERLCATADPLQRFVGATLRWERKQPVDLAAAHATFASLPESTQTALLTVIARLPRP